MRKVFCESLGKEIELKDRCERIISFSPSATEAFFIMGLERYVIGVSSYCVHPEKAMEKEVMGTYSNANIERLKQVAPDLIITTTGYQRNFAYTLSQEFPTYAFELPSTVSGIIETMVRVGVVAGYYDEARKLEKNLLTQILSGFAKNENTRRKVYIEIDLGGPVTFGAFSYITDALEILGAKNIFGDKHCEWLKPEKDEIREKEPDIIFYEPKMFYSGREKGRSEVKLEAVIENFCKRGLGNLECIKKGRVHIPPGRYDFLAHHGPSFITDALRWLNEKLD